MSSRRGFAPVTSTAFSLPFATAKSVVAVRLHEIGLVDALLLDVRAGVVDALLAGARAVAGAAAARRHRLDDSRRLPAEAVGADEAARLRLRVVEQVAARAERARGAALGRLRGRTAGVPPARRRRGRPARPERDGEQSSSPWLYAVHPKFVTPIGVHLSRMGTTRSDQGGSNRRTPKGAPMSLLWIILIVVLVLALLGFFGRGRF